MINFTKHSRVDHGEIVDQNRPWDDFDGSPSWSAIYYKNQGAVEGQK